MNAAADARRSDGTVAGCAEGRICGVLPALVDVVSGPSYVYMSVVFTAVIAMEPTGIERSGVAERR